MAAKTSNGTGGGNWSSTATWSGGVVPVAGTDTVTIAAGDTVNVDSASESSGQLIIGSDPGTGGTAALTIGSSSQTTATNVVVNTGVTIRLRGDLTIVGQNATNGAFSTLTLSSGASLIMDPPSTDTYKFNFSYFAQIISNGATNTGVWPDTSGGNHCVIKTDLTRGGDNATPVFLGGIGPGSGATFGGFVTHSFTDFSNLGTSALYGVVSAVPTLATASSSYPTKAISISNCTFTGCNYWVGDDNLSSAYWWTGEYNFSDNIFSSSVLCGEFGFTNNCCAWTLHNPPTVSPKQILRCSFDQPILFDGSNNPTFAGNFVGADAAGDSLGLATTAVSSWANNFWVITGSGSPLYLADSTSNYFLYTGSGASGKFFPVYTSATVTNSIWDADTVAGNGLVDFPSGGTFTFIGNIVLQVAGTTQTTGILSISGGSADTITVEHNLQVGYAATHGFVELYSTDWTAASVRSNIIWSSTATSQVMAITDLTPDQLDAVTLAGYNAFHNPTSGTCKYNAGASSATVVGYGGVEVTNATPFAAQGAGAGNTQLQTGFDFTADPTFADSTLRNVAKWNNIVQGGSATYAAAIATLQATPSLIPSMITWVKAGYVPTNAVFAHTTYSGDTFTTDANGNPANGTVGPLGFPSGSLLRQASMDGLAGGPFFGNSLSGM